MNDHNNEPQINWALLSKFWQLVTPYWKEDFKRQAWRLLLIMILFITIMSVVNAYKTYITKWAINALSNKDQRQFYHIMLLAVFSLGASVPIVALKIYYQNKLSLYWRKWFNLKLLKSYFTNNAYYKMNLYSNVDNPDQRIAEDLNNFVTESTNFFSIFLLSLISIVTYIGVLGSISISLVIAVFIYATFGTLIIVWLSKKLIKLNFRNIKLQANYRYNLVHVRDNLESIAFYQGEHHERSVLVEAFEKLFINFKNLIILKRNITFASEAYTLFAALIPFLLLAPKMFAGQIEVGTIVQASTVFAILLADLSVIVNQFSTLSTLAATAQRLSGFVSGLTVESSPGDTIEHQQASEFQFREVTVQTPQRDKTLVTGLNLTIKNGTGLMIVGASGCGKSSLLRAIAGLWTNGQGLMASPAKNQIMFLPQKPYMLIGSLKEQLIYPHLDSEITDQTLQQALESVGLGELVQRVGGLDKVMNWSDLLSLGEQQRIIFLRLLLTKPAFAILDESSSALDEPNEAHLYQLLRESGITYISVGHRSSLITFHDNILNIKKDGHWELYPQSEYQH